MGATPQPQILTRATVPLLSQADAEKAAGHIAETIRIFVIEDAATPEDLNDGLTLNAENLWVLQEIAPERFAELRLAARRKRISLGVPPDPPPPETSTTTRRKGRRT